MSPPRRITISQARRSFAAVLAHARAGQEVEITSRGAVVARLLPAEKAEPVAPVERVFGGRAGPVEVRSVILLPTVGGGGTVEASAGPAAGCLFGAR